MTTLTRLLAEALDESPAVNITMADVEQMASFLQARGVRLDATNEPEPQGTLARLERFSRRAEVNGKVDAEQLRKAIAQLRLDATKPDPLDVEIARARELHGEQHVTFNWLDCKQDPCRALALRVSASVDREDRR